MTDHEKAVRLAAACRRVLAAKRELALAEAELKAVVSIVHATESEPEPVMVKP